MDKNKIGSIFLIAFGIIMLLAGIASIYYLIIDPYSKVNFYSISDGLIFFIVGPVLIYLGKNWKKRDFTKED